MPVRGTVLEDFQLKLIFWLVISKVQFKASVFEALPCSLRTTSQRGLSINVRLSLISFRKKLSSFFPRILQTPLRFDGRQRSFCLTLEERRCWSLLLFEGSSQVTARSVLMDQWLLSYYDPFRICNTNFA